MLPKSFAVETMPRPKCHCQIRFTITRAVRGCSGRVSQSARSFRLTARWGVNGSIGPVENGGETRGHLLFGTI